MFHYKKIESHRELGFAKAWRDKILTKLSLGHDSKSNTTNMTGNISYNSMKIDASHSSTSKKTDKKAKTKKIQNRLTIKGKKFLLKARNSSHHKKNRNGTSEIDQRSQIDFNDSHLGLNADIVIEKSANDNGKYNAANDTAIRATVQSEKLGINATANVKKSRIKHTNSYNQTVNVERNQSRANITAKKIHLTTSTNKYSEQEDKTDKDGKIIAQNRKTAIDSSIDIATTHITTNMAIQHTKNSNALKKIRNATVEIKDEHLNVQANVAVNQKYYTNGSKNNNYTRKQQIKTTATAKGVGITGSLNMKKVERCKSDDKEKTIHKDKESHIDMEINLPKNSGQIQVSYDKAQNLTLDDNQNILATHSQCSENIQFANSNHKFTLGHDRVEKKHHRTTLIQDKIAGSIRTKNNIHLSANLNLKRIHKKGDYHTTHKQQFSSVAALKGDKKSQLLLTAKRRTDNQLDPVTGALTSQQRIEAGVAANTSHTLYMTASRTHHDRESSVLNSRYGTANYANGRASANAIVEQITLHDKNNNQKTQSIWAKFCALGYRLFFSSSNSQKFDYSGQPVNKQRQNVSITLSDDKKDHFLKIALSCIRKKHQGEFKIGVMLRNFFKKCKRKYIFKFSWKKCNENTREESDLIKPVNDANSHKAAANSTIDLSASCRTTMTTEPCSRKKVTNYKGNFKFFGYNCKMEYLESNQYNKNSADLSQHSMNDATMMTSASA